MSDDSSESRHMVLVLVGFGLLLVGAFVFYLGTVGSQWPGASAQVLTVEVKCEMQDTRPRVSRYGRPRQSVVIGCDQVNRFRADNPDGSWSLSRRYSGKVRVTRDGQDMIVAMGLAQVGLTPAVGETFQVVQNPDRPGDVRFPDRSVGEMAVGAMLGGLGVFVLAFAFFLT